MSETKENLLLVKKSFFFNNKVILSSHIYLFVLTEYNFIKWAPGAPFMYKSALYNIKCLRNNKI